jgi:hypothetical protein
MELTYQQVLAEVYEENAKNTLVHQTEYDDEDQPPYEEYDYEENELPDKDEFNKPSGNRNKPEHIIVPTKKPEGLGLANIKKDNIFRMSVLNIDGQFRGSQVPVIGFINNCEGQFVLGEPSVFPGSVQLGTRFSFRTARQYKNVYSVEVTSVEFPNNFYTFSSSRGNTTFTITYLNVPYTITIPDGNYTNLVNTTTGTPYLPGDTTVTPNLIPGSIPDTTTLLGAIQQVINYTPGLGNLTEDGYYTSFITVNYLQHLHQVYFLVTGDIPIQITFPSVETNSYGNGIGYNLGFIQTERQPYSSQLLEIPGQIPNLIDPNSLLQLLIIAETFPDTIQDHYIHLKLSDWDLLTQQNPNQTSFTAFLKIPLTAQKFTMQHDNNSLNTTTKKYFFHQPTNINLIVISLLDAYGNVLDLKYSSFSLTLQIQEVLSTATYESLLDNT